MPINQGNPLEAPERDELPLVNLVVYEHQEERLEESAWPRLWMQRVRDRFRLRCSEASRNFALRAKLLELLQAAQEVKMIISIKFK